MRRRHLHAVDEPSPDALAAARSDLLTVDELRQRLRLKSKSQAYHVLRTSGMRFIRRPSGRGKGQMLVPAAEVDRIIAQGFVTGETE